MKEQVNTEILHSLVSPRSVVSALEADYELGKVSDCHLLSAQLNDVYSLTATSGHYIARLSPHCQTTQQNPLFEIGLLQNLRAQGIRVSEPIKAQNSAYHTLVHAPEGDRVLALFRPAKGRYITMSKRDYGILGSAQAKLHQATTDFQVSVKGRNLDLDCLIEQPLQSMHPIAGTTWKGFQDIANHIRRKFEEDFKGKLRWGVCHGDAWANINIDDQDVATFFDFEFCGYGWTVYDVATVKWGLKSEKQDETIWDAFFSSYCATNLLLKVELKAIPLFVVARDFWALGNLTANANRWGHHRLTSDFFGNRLDAMKKLAEVV